MREDYTTYLPEREFITSDTREELDSLYDEISTIQPLEDD
jgi:hypothetical protein